MVTTLNLEQASVFLHMNIETVRRLAQQGVLPAAKPGKRWVFIEEDLADWLRSQYIKSRQMSLSETQKNGGKACRSTNATKYGGLTLQHRQESELSVLLKQR